MKPLRLLVILFAALVGAVTTVRAQTSPGDVEPNFSIGTGANSRVFALVRQPDGKFLVGGQFTTFNGLARNRIVRLNENGSVDTSFDPGRGADSTVNSVALASDGKVIIGGDFFSYNGAMRYRVARLNSDGSVDTTFAPTPGTDGSVQAVAVQPDGKVLVAGGFTAVNGVARTRVARFNADGTLDTTFNPGTGPNGYVLSLVLMADGRILIGGYFSAVGGVTRHRIARLNSDGTLDTTFTPGTTDNGYVNSISIASDGKLLVCGGLYIGENARLVRLLDTGAVDSTFNVGNRINSDVCVSLTQVNGKILIGGYFTSIGGVSRNGIARLNADGTLDPLFDPGTGANHLVWSLVLEPGGVFVAGGSFTSYDGASRNRITRIYNDNVFVNQAPIADPISSLTILEDGGVTNVVVTGIAPGPLTESTQTVSSVTAFSSNPAIIQHPLVAYTPGGTNATVTFAPELNAYGVVTISVVLQDDGGNTAGGVNITTNTFTVTVTPVNDAPIFNVMGFPVVVREDSGPVTTNVISRIFVPPSFDLASSLVALPGATNETNQTFTFVIVTNTHRALFSVEPSISANGMMTFTPERNAMGQAAVVFYVQDSGGTDFGGVNTSAWQTVSIFISPLNDPPTLLMTDGSASGLTNGSFEVPGLFPGWTLSGWGGGNSPAQVNPLSGFFNLNTIGTLQGTFGFGHNFSTTLTGGETNRLCQDVPVSASAPYLSFKYDAIWDMRDATNTQPRVFKVTVEPAGGGAALTNVTFVSARPGTYSGPNGLNSTFGLGVQVGFVDLRAFAGSTVRVCFDWIIPDPNNGAGGFVLDDVRMLPRAGSLTALTLPEDAGPQTVYLSGVSTGPFNEVILGFTSELTITATSSNPNLIPDPTVVFTNFWGTGQLRFTPAAHTNGTAVITVIARDNQGTFDGGVDAVTNTFTVTVNSVNDAPALDPAGYSVPLPNGGFENGNLDNWGFNGSSGQVAPVGDTSFFYYYFFPLTNAPTEGTNSFVGLASGFSSFMLSREITVSNAAPSLAFDYRLAWNRQDYLPYTFFDQTNMPSTFRVYVHDAGTGTLLATNVIYTMPYGSRREDTGNLAGLVDLSAFVGQTVRVVFYLEHFGQDVGFVTLFMDNVRLFSAIAPTTVNEDAGRVTISLPGLNPGGPEETSQTLTLTVTSSNPGVVPTPTASHTNGVPGGTLTFNTLTNVYGSSIVTVVIRDNGGTANGGVNAATNKFLVTVNPVNDAPSVTFTTNNVVVLEDSGIITGLIVASTNVGPANETNQTITNITVVGVSDPSLFNVQPAVALDGTLTFTPAPNAFGIATVTVAVQDDGGTDNGGVDTGTNTFTITITPVNDAPTFTLAAPTVTVLEDSGSSTNAGFAIFSAGPNESGQIVTFTLTNGNNALFSVQPAISTNGTLTFTPATNASGSATITVFAQDNGGTANGGVDTAASQTFTIVVTAVNDAPTFTKGADQVTFQGDGAQTVTNWATAISPGPADEVGQLLNFTIANNNNGIFTTQPALSVDGTLTWTPLPGTSGVAVVTLQLLDDGGTANGGTNGSVVQTFTITVASTKIFVGSVPEVSPEGAVQAPISLAGLGAENSVSFTFDFNPSHLAISSVSLGSGATGATLMTNTTQLASGKLGVVVLRPVGTTFPAGTNELLQLGVRALGTSPVTNSPLTFSSTPVYREVTDTNADVLSYVAYVAGFVPVVTPGTAVEGDVSPRPAGNGIVSVTDAVQVGRFVSGLDTAASGSEFQRADSAPRATSGNGAITLADLVQTLRFAAGLDTPGAPGGPTTQTASLRTAAVLPAGARTVRVVGGALVSGRANTVSVQLDAQGDEAGLSLSLSYDPTVLAFVSAAPGSGAAGGSLVVNSSKAGSGRVGLVMVMPAGTTIAAGSQSVITLTFNVTGSGSTAINVTGDSPVAREVADVNANVLGATYVNGTFNLILPAGLKAAGMERASDGSLRLVVRNADGTPVTAAQIARYQVHVTSNLGGVWTVLPNALVVENGALKIVDPSSGSAGLRLYKLVETP